MTTAQRERTVPAPGSLSVLSRVTGMVGRLAPAHRDGLALVLSSALTSGIGLLYWVVAARLFAPETVGVNSVALATMMLLGSIAHLNMTYALLRFLPVAGLAGRRLVIGGYLVGAGVAALVGGLFALGAPLWASELVEAVGHGPLVLFFVIATPIWAIFVMQDYVLTAVGRATIVPVENLGFSLLKILLLASAAHLALPGGIAVSWVAATGVIVVTLNAWLLLRAIPRFGRRAKDNAVPITIGAVARFIRADYAGAVFWQVAMFGLPVLVLARLGAEEAATYGIVWTIAQALYLVSSGMGQSMVAHSAADPTRIEEARRATVRRAIALVIPAAVVLTLGAPLVLSVFGEHYVETGTAALVLAVLSAVPNVVTASTISAARVRQRMGVLFGVPAAVTLIVVSLSWVLMPVLGITAVSLSWLIAQLIVAGGILLAGAPWLPPLLATRIDAVRGAVLLRRVDTEAVLKACGADPGSWVVRERLAGGSTSVVVGVGPDTGPGALLKVVESARGQVEMRWQTSVLAALHGDPRIAHLHRLVPEVVTSGDVGGTYYTVETRLDGAAGPLALLDPVRRRVFASSAVATISELHRCTSTASDVTDDDLQRWVHRPMAAVSARLPRGLRASAARLEHELAAALRGSTVAVGWTHGDFGPGNTLTDLDGRVVGIVDWCNADERGLAVLDVMCFQLLSQVMAGDEELGDLVVRLLSESPPPDHALLVRAQRMLGGAVLDVELVCLLAWLQHVSQGLIKSAQYGANPVWTRRNLFTVIRDAPALLQERASARPPEPARTQGATFRASDR